MNHGRLAAVMVVFVGSVLAQEPVTASRPDSRATIPTVDATSRPATAGVYYARLLISKVRLRAGPGEMHSEIARLNSGDLVHVIGANAAGDWARVEVPGGVTLWVATAIGAKPLVQVSADDDGLVLVNDLQIRGTPSTDEPPVGALKAGEHVSVVEKRGDWARIQMPTSHAAFVAARYLKPVIDATTAAKEFADKDVAARKDIVVKRDAARAERLRHEAEVTRKKLAEEQFGFVKKEREKPVSERDFKGMKAALQKVVDGTPSADDPDRRRAEQQIDLLNEQEVLTAEAAKATALFETAERARKEAEETVQKDLEAIRLRKEAEGKLNDTSKKTYLATGHVRLAPPLTGFLDKTPKHAIHKGGQREYYLVSDKYDLSDFNGKLVGILEWDPPEERPGLPFRVARVKKLEIILGQ